ncbi:hypothetical protein ACFVAJ_09805 [Agromyces sp. NPDC057679]|uniref:hypothetical protein n=1 Tax=Agromyces sp. NPDC057679 TaxID=3346207 RepID=UPI00366E32B5
MPELRPTRTLLAVSSLLAAAALLTGCTSAGPVTAETTPPAVTASPTPTPTPDSSDGGTLAAPGLTVVPTVDGDCPADPSEFGVVTLVVTTNDDTTPIEIEYTAFRPGADPVVRTTQAVGPVVVLMQSDCGTQTASEPWTFTASASDSLSCTMTFGSKRVASDDYYAEGSTDEATVDCSGHPGM